MATGAFYIRQNKDTGIIWFRFSYKRGISPFRKSTGEQIPSNSWDAKKQKVKEKVSTGAYASRVNKRLDHIQKKFEERTKGVIITPSLLENIWNSMDQKTDISFLDFCKDYVERSKTEPNKKTKRILAKNTLASYDRSYALLEEYMKKNRELSFAELDEHFHKGFTDFLSNKGISGNSIKTYISRIKSFAMVAAKKYNVNEFILSPEFFATEEETFSVFANEKEIKKIAELELTNRNELRVRNWFIIGCWTGLRVSDWKRVGDMNSKNITIKPQKTAHSSGRVVVIPIHDQIKDILENFGMPKLVSESHFNKTIKVIFKKAKITHKEYASKVVNRKRKVDYFSKDQLISSHTCRRSFATNNYLMGIDTLTIMQITGHSTEKSFLKYIKVTPTQHAERLRDKWKEYYTDKSLKENI